MSRCGNGKTPIRSLGRRGGVGCFYGSRPVCSTLTVPIVEHLTNLDALTDHPFTFFAVPVPVRGMGTFRCARSRLWAELPGGLPRSRNSGRHGPVFTFTLFNDRGWDKSHFGWDKSDPWTL